MREKETHTPDLKESEPRQEQELEFVDTHCSLIPLFTRSNFRGIDLSSFISSRKSEAMKFPVGFQGCISVFNEAEVICPPPLPHECLIDQEVVARPPDERIDALLVDPMLLGALFGLAPACADSWGSDIEALIMGFLGACVSPPRHPFQTSCNGSSTGPGFGVRGSGLEACLLCTVSSTGLGPRLLSPRQLQIPHCESDSRAFHGFFPGRGLHERDRTNFYLCLWSRGGKAVGVGGCGLDYTCGVGHGQQILCLEAQARIAVESGERQPHLLPTPPPPLIDPPLATY